MEFRTTRITDNGLKITAVLDAEKEFIEYVNDYLTIEMFAKDKGYSLLFAEEIIEAGRRLNLSY